MSFKVYQVNKSKNRQTKGQRMQMSQIRDPARARAYFEDKVAFSTGPVELEHMIKSGEPIVVVDVREAEDYSRGHVPGAINLPKGTWASPEGMQKDKTSIVYCYTQTCHLAANACVAFAGQGYPVVELEGGFEGWKSNEFELEGQSDSRLKKTSERMAGRRH
jgi:rhodanese-related sulfurtransferase